MALNISRLQASLKSNIEAQFGAPNPDDVYLNKYCLALATAIIGEITSHAELHSAHLNSDAITGIVTMSSVTGTVTDPSVVGGIS